MLPRKGRDPLHLGEVEDLALEPSHRGFYRDRTDRGRDAGFRKAGDLGLDLGEGKGRALRSERDQGQTAQLLRAVTGIVVDMAFALHEHAAAARREKTQRQMVGERSARQKQRHLLAEQRRHPLLELGDDPLPREFVGGDAAFFGQPDQQPGIFGRRQGQAVGAKMHSAIHSLPLL